jgi:predicted RNA-binding protein with RPS1 domain
MKNYQKGQVIKCQVTGIEKYGIFVKVDNEYTGLIHISEISNDFVRNIDDYVKIDDNIYAQIIEVDKTNNQLKLSIKDLDYKETGEKKKSLEAAHGFKPLAEALPNWTNEKINEYKKTS